MSDSVKFPLGQTVMTPGVQNLVFSGACNPGEVLARHQSGDWGDLDDEDKQMNEEDLVLGERLLSKYHVGPGRVAIYVITERDRSVTTLLLPSEY